MAITLRDRIKTDVKPAAPVAGCVVARGLAGAGFPKPTAPRTTRTTTTG